MSPLVERMLGRDISGSVYEGLIHSEPPEETTEDLNSICPGSASFDPKGIIYVKFAKIPEDKAEKYASTINTLGWNVAQHWENPLNKVKGGTDAHRFVAQRAGQLNAGAVLEPRFNLPVHLPEETIFYHACPTRKVGKILALGLNPREGGKRGFHPSRVYLTRSQADAIGIAAKLQHATQLLSYTILQVKMSPTNDYSFNHSVYKVFVDPAFPEGVYTPANIPPNRIKVVQELRYKTPTLT